MKILHVVTGLGVGGAENILCRLIEAMPGDESEHVVVSLSDDNALRTRLLRAGAKVIVISLAKKKSLLTQVLRLRKVVSLENPAVIHGWMYHGNLAASLSACGRSIPVIWSIRQSLYDIESEKPLTRFIIRFCSAISRCPALILYNSSASADHHREFGFSHERCRIIPNGFETDLFKPDESARCKIRREFGLGKDEFVVGMIARYHPVKNHQMFLHGASLFARTNPRAKFMLVGTNVCSDNEDLRRQVQALGLEEKLILAGRRDDVADICAALDVVVSTSVAESFPNSVAEGMASGLICIATDVGDVREIVGDAGIVIKPGQVDALVEALKKTLDMGSERRCEIGAIARKRVIERYSVSQMTKQFVACYEQVKEQ